MIKTLTYAHSVIVRSGNAVAQLIVTRLNQKFRKSNFRSLKAIALREDICFSTKLVCEQETDVRKNISVQLKAAQRLINA